MIGITMVMVWTISLRTAQGACGIVHGTYFAPWSVEMTRLRGGHGCHGVLVEEHGRQFDSRFVVTLASCWEENPESPLYSAQTFYNPDRAAVKICEVGHVRIGNKLILLKLKERITFSTFVQPICLFHGDFATPRVGMTHTDSTNKAQIGPVLRDHPNGQPFHTVIHRLQQHGMVQVHDQFPYTQELRVHEVTFPIEQPAQLINNPSAADLEVSMETFYANTAFSVPTGGAYYAKTHHEGPYYLWGLYVDDMGSSRRYHKVSSHDASRILVEATAKQPACCEIL